MTEVIFILPREDGWEAPSGEEFRHSCSENDPISSLFDVVRKRLSEDDVRLSLETMGGKTAALMAIDPRSRDTVSSLNHPVARIIVGFSRA
jgi:hypothetical protein